MGPGVSLNCQQRESIPVFAEMIRRRRFVVTALTGLKSQEEALFKNLKSPSCRRIHVDCFVVHSSSVRLRPGPTKAGLVHKSTAAVSRWIEIRDHLCMLHITHQFCTARGRKPRSDSEFEATKMAIEMAKAGSRSIAIFFEQ